MIFVYLFLINVVTFFLCAIDKRAARAGNWRISEKTLFMFALIGGSPGLLAGMKSFRHKTRKASFQLVVGLILVVQIFLLYQLFNGDSSEYFLLD